MYEKIKARDPSEISLMTTEQVYIALNKINNAMREMTGDPPELFWSLDEVKALTQEERIQKIQFGVAAYNVAVCVMNIGMAMDKKARARAYSTSVRQHKKTEYDWIDHVSGISLMDKVMDII